MKKRYNWLFTALFSMIMCVLVLGTATLQESLASNITVQQKIVEAPNSTPLIIVLPTSLPITIDKNGKSTTKDNITIKNSNPSDLRITKVKVEPLNGWELVDDDYDFSTVKVGTKKFKISLNNQNFSENAFVNTENSKWPDIKPAEAMNLLYSINISPQKDAIRNEKIANIIFEATLIEPQYPIIANSLPESEIILDKLAACANEPVNLTVKSPEGCGVKTATVNGEPLKKIEQRQKAQPHTEKYSFVMPSEPAYVLVETSKLHSVNIHPLGNKGIAYTNSPLSAAGSEVQLYISPAEGFYIKQITVNNKPITGTTFVMPDEPVTVKIHFTSSFEDANIDTGYFIFDPKNHCITGYKEGMPANIVIPKSFGTVSVHSIGEDAFEECEYLQTVIIEDGLRTIGNGAFEGCSALTSVKMPNSVAEIGEGAFSECSSLEEIHLSSHLASIPKECFSDCISLTDIEIPNSVVDVGDYSFSGCKSLRCFTTGTGTKTLGYRIFEGCASLSEVFIGDGVAYIPDELFLDCHSLGVVVLGTGVRIIGYNTFFACSSLTSITIPENVKDIGHEAFGKCNALTEIIIKSKKNSIEGAPWGAPKITAENIHWMESPNKTRLLENTIPEK